MIYNLTAFWWWLNCTILIFQREEKSREKERRREMRGEKWKEKERREIKKKREEMVERKGVERRGEKRKERLNGLQYLASCHCIHTVFPQWGRSSHGQGCHSCSCSKGCRRPCPSSIYRTRSTLCSLWSLRWCTCHGLSSYSGMSLSF